MIVYKLVHHGCFYNVIKEPESCAEKKRGNAFWLDQGCQTGGTWATYTS
jgi:hypothetical protein